MNVPQNQLIIFLLIFGNCLCCNNWLHADSSKLESNSPFLPPGYSRSKSKLTRPVQQTGRPINQELEFRGIIQLNGMYHFSVFKKSENKGYWIPENASENGISVSNFDTDSMQITVTHNGRSERLTLMAASENPLPVVTTPKPPTSTSQTPILPSAAIQPSGNTKQNTPTKRVIPRRRVILPSKQ